MSMYWWPSLISVNDADLHKMYKFWNTSQYSNICLFWKKKIMLRQWGPSFAVTTKLKISYLGIAKGCCGRDHMIVGFTTTYAISAYHHQCCEFESCSSKVNSIQHYVIKFVSDLQQVNGFFRVLRFSSPIKMTATIKLKYWWKWC